MTFIGSFLLGGALAGTPAPANDTVSAVEREARAANHGAVAPASPDRLDAGAPGPETVYLFFDDLVVHPSADRGVQEVDEAATYDVSTLALV